MRYAGALTAILLAITLLAAGCVNAPPDRNAGAPGGPSGKVRIGLSMDTLKEERWQSDRDLFLARAQELGAEVLVQVANGDDAVQTQQSENLLTQGVDVLVVVPHNGEVAASIVDSAKRQGVPVISYDRLIRNSDVDLYISFDNVKVGELQAKYLLERAPKGNYVLIGGAPTDNNARLFREGQMNVLKPAIDSGDIKIVADQWAREWLANEALKHTENALTQANNNVAAVVVSNDGTAGGVVQALEEQKLSGKVLVSGQDADVAALQRILEGKQSMTVYKPIKPLATRAAEAAIALARKEKPETNGAVNNGRKDVPSILLEPVVVDKSNIADTVIKDGFRKLEDVYKNVPRDQWPQAAQAKAIGGN
ncbi:MAG TPA: D-xylose ABC transporter substrate-binding protein [Blastocatellia bacterium]|nr:D-xylose ABC transporter substrate-binding protein [Blastocatellia bacterium]